MSDPIYLDYNATTPIAPSVIKAMRPYLDGKFGNPSSNHPYGTETKDAVENARKQTARLLTCDLYEIVFTSSGTESNNHAIRGVMLHNSGRGKHIITSAIEHPAVIEVCRWLNKGGYDLSILPVDGTGLVNPDDLRSAIQPGTILVSIMGANNEVGTIQPIRDLAEITHEHGAIFHTDAAQAVGKLKVDVKELGVDLLSVAGHKLYAPKGVGALYIRDGIELTNLLFGAGHENGRRPGTENVLEIVGLGAACQIADREHKETYKHLETMRDRLHNGLIEQLGSEMLRLNGHPTQRLPNTLSLCFKNIPGNILLDEMSDKVAASAGSACHADQVSVSGVLEAMQVPLEWAMGTIRFSVGRGTTADEIDQAVDTITNAVFKIRNET